MPRQRAARAAADEPRRCPGGGPPRSRSSRASGPRPARSPAAGRRAVGRSRRPRPALAVEAEVRAVRPAPGRRTARRRRRPAAAARAGSARPRRRAAPGWWPARPPAGSAARPGRAAAPPRPGRARSCPRRAAARGRRRYSMTVCSMPRPVPLLHPQRGRHRVAHGRAVRQRRELAQPHAVAEPRLARPAASTASRVLPTPPTPVSVTSGPSRTAAATRAHLVLAADEARSRAGAGCRRAAGRARARRRRPRRPPVAAAGTASPSRICWCTCAQRRAGVGAQLLDAAASRICLVGGERVGLPTAAVLREHELPGQALVERVGADRGGQLDEQLGVPPGAQRRVVAVQRDGDAARPPGRCGHRRTTGCRARRRARPATGRAPARTARPPRRPVGGGPRLGGPGAGTGAGPPTAGRSAST